MVLSDVTQITFLRELRALFRSSVLNVPIVNYNDFSLSEQYALEAMARNFAFHCGGSSSTTVVTCNLPQILRFMLQVDPWKRVGLTQDEALGVDTDNYADFRFMGTIVFGESPFLSSWPQGLSTSRPFTWGNQSGTGTINSTIDAAYPPNPPMPNVNLLQSVSNQRAFSMNQGFIDPFIGKLFYAEGDDGACSFAFTIPDPNIGELGC
jgi:hypothetical protein